MVMQSAALCSVLKAWKPLHEVLDSMDSISVLMDYKYGLLFSFPEGRSHLGNTGGVCFCSLPSFGV